MGDKPTLWQENMTNTLQRSYTKRKIGSWYLVWKKSNFSHLPWDCMPHHHEGKRGEYTLPLCASIFINLKNKHEFRNGDNYVVFYKVDSRPGVLHMVFTIFWSLSKVSCMYLFIEFFKLFLKLVLKYVKHNLSWEFFK